VSGILRTRQKLKPQRVKKMERHCDDYIRDKTQPKCLRLWLLYNRIPATWKFKHWRWPVPTLYATLSAKGADLEHCRKFDTLPGRVRLTMASRFGDVGITNDLIKGGYTVRVYLDVLSDFSEKP
jgi:hypothetical protein